MTVTRKCIEFEDWFNRGQTYSSTPGDNGWTIKDTSAAGQPVYANQNGGGGKLLCDNTSEAQIVTLYQNDVLWLPLLNVKLVRLNLLVGAFDANTVAVAGLASAQNDTEDSVATNAWFKVIGGASTHSIVCETDDGTTDTDDVATSQLLSTTSKELIIDFTRGINDIRFAVDGQPVAQSQQFSMAAATGSTYVQPFFQLHKASGTGVGYIKCDHIKVEYDLALGA